MLVAEDSISGVEGNEAPVAEMTSPESGMPVEVAMSNHHVAGQMETPAPEPAMVPKPETKPEPKKTSAPVYGIPVVIDVDTITQMWPTDEELNEGNSRLY